MKRYLVVIVLLLVIISTVGCIHSKNKATTTSSITITDDFGRNVTIPYRPERIVSLAPSTTEILFAIGAGDRVVGVDDYSNYPPEVVSLPKIGGYATINVERVVSLKPDLVVAAYGNGIDTIEALNSLGIKVVGLNPRSLDDILHDIDLLGKVTGTQENATRLINEMKKRIDTVKDATEEVTHRPRILHVIWHDPLWTAGNGTFENEMISIAGGENIASDIDGYSVISLETVVDRDPEVIITTSGGGMGLAGRNLSYEYITTDSRFVGITAVKEGRVYVIDADIACRPGPRIVDALEQIFRFIHHNT
ncbi:MAG: ABC transporter substrate-binding protein [Candidatus Syntropharchaeia archaeon]